MSGGVVEAGRPPGEPFRWGLLGAGAIARKFAESIALLDDHRVGAVGSRTAPRAERLAAAVGARATDYGAVLGDPEIDAVYVGVPAAAHRDLVVAAIEAGKPVLCEKPFASTGADATAMAEAARARGVFCMEAMWTRFLPAARALHAAVDGGAIGQPRLLLAELGAFVPYDPVSRFYDAAQGGGALLDLGVYPISLAWWLLGEPVAGRAVLTSAPSGVDAQATVVLSHQGGALASLTCSFEQRLRNRAFVAGSEGSVETDAPLYAPTRLVFTKGAPPPGPEGEPSARPIDRLLTHPSIVAARRRFAPALRQLIRRERRAEAHPFPGHGYQFEALEVARCVRAGLVESPVVPLDTSVRILRALDHLRDNGRFEASDLG